MKKKFIFLVIYILIVFLFSTYIMHYCYVISEVGFSNATTEKTLSSLGHSPFLVYGLINSSETVLVGMMLSFATCTMITMFILFSVFNNKNYKYKGVEHGSARFATLSEIKTVIDSNENNNRILSMNARLSLNGRKIRRNSNIAIFGGSGAGKTYFWLKPNLMQKNSTYIITDPKGEILRECGKMLEDDGYIVKVFDLTDIDNSDYYNPLAYIDMDKEQDIISLISFIMENTNDGQKSKDPFWDGAEKMLITAMFFYILYEGGENEKNIDTMMYLINKIDLNKKPNEIDVVDELFGEFAEKYGRDHIAIRNYLAFRNGGEKNQGSILLTNSARLNLFNLVALKKLTSADTIDLKSIGDEQKVALFIITSPADRSLNFLAGLMYTQLFKILDNKANKIYGGSLPIPVAFFLDEFANIGKIPNFTEILAYARSLNISIVPILQSLSQLKKMYEKDWESILDNCDTTIFLGGKGADTTKYFSEMLGTTTIDMLAQNKSYGQQKSTSLNESNLGRKLLTPEELSQLDVNKCIVFIKGHFPFMDKKFVPSSHKNYKLTGDYDKCNQYQFRREEIEFDFNFGKKEAPIEKEIDIEYIQNEIEAELTEDTVNCVEEQKDMVDNFDNIVDEIFTDDFDNEESEEFQDQFVMSEEDLQEKISKMDNAELQDMI